MLRGPADRAAAIVMSASSGSGGVDLPTLAITAAASATAAYVCSKLWAPGTLGAAATMPVLIALLKEAYAKPAHVVTRAVPVRGVVRSSPSAGAPDEPASLPESPQERVPQPGEIRGRSRPVPRHAWKMAFLTGLLGFVVAAVIITVPEIVAGQSAAGDRQTTFFGGKQGAAGDADETNTTTEPTETVGAPASPTVTVAPSQTTTVPPAQTTTLPPAQTTPVPPAPEEEEGEFPPPPAP